MSKQVNLKKKKRKKADEVVLGPLWMHGCMASAVHNTMQIIQDSRRMTVTVKL